MSVLVLGIVVLLALAWLANFLRKPSVKGSLGEWRVRLHAFGKLDGRIYRALHDVTLPTPEGTTQIDHLFVSRYGIFVLETKNMRGLISGHSQADQWTQQLRQRSFNFPNPLRQNYAHLKALEAVLGVELVQLRSVVAFVGKSSFTSDMPINVTEGAGFVGYIRSFRKEVFSEREVGKMVEKLQRVRLPSTRATHREHVRRIQRRRELRLTTCYCPACGSEMVRRTARTGRYAGQPFWGCSSFPRCRAILRD